MEREFRFFDLAPPVRMALAGLLYAASAALQLATGGVFPGILLALAGWFPLMLKPATNRPDDQGLEEWRPVSAAEVDRLDDGIRSSRALRKKTGAVARGVGAGCAIPLLFAGGVLALLTGRGDFAFVGANALVFALPAVFFGRVKVFIPPEIDRKMGSFRAVLAEPVPATARVAPYIRFDKDPKGRDVPEDLRLLLELKRPPADLVGIQLQATINNGPNGPVPYLYAVVLTRGKGMSHEVARKCAARGYVVEAGGDGEYGTVVLRQETSSGGYHTSPDDCRALARLCYKVLERIAAA